MKICTNCGAENNKTATYCITCGLPLTDTYAPPMQGATGRGKPKVVIIMAIAIALAGVAAALFMVSSGNKKTTTGTTEVSQNEKNTAATDDETEADIAKEKLKNVSAPGKYVIDDQTLSRISVKVNHFINKNNKEDVEAILDYFSYPVYRYHKNYNVSRAKLKSTLQNTVNTLEHHKLKADLSKGTVSFDGRTYEIIFNATYEWATLEKPNDINIIKVRLKYMMNKNLKLTSAYEM